MSRRKPGQSTHCVGDPIASVLVLADLAPLLGLGATQLWRLEQAGEFEEWELKPRKGARARYSGSKVKAWLESETTDTTDTEARAAGSLARFRRPNHGHRAKDAASHGFIDRSTNRAESS